MKEYTVDLVKVQTQTATIIVNASSPEEAKARAEDWLNNGQDNSDSDEFIVDHDDDPFGGRDFQEIEWKAGRVDK